MGDTMLGIAGPVVVLAGQSVHAVLGAKTERRAILGYVSGIEVDVKYCCTRCARRSRPGRLKAATVA